jgi:cobalt-zinc-cadmium efflux system protein
MPHHHHDHATGHGDDEHGRAFAIGVALNAAFVVAEVAGGLAANSMALLADAVHNLGDVLGLLLAWGATWLGQQPPGARRTYGWGRSSILAALVNAAVLLISVGAIGVEAIRRLILPEPVATLPVMAIAGAGIVINGATALLFARGRSHDLNIRAAFMHMASDAGLSLGVVVAAALIRITDWLWLDSVASLVLVAVITWGTWGLLRESVDLALDAVPEGISREAVQSYLAGLSGVVEVHDLHIWALSTTETALTAHLVCRDDADRRRLHELSTELQAHFGIGHATVQVETETEAALCQLRPDHVV